MKSKTKATMLGRAFITLALVLFVHDPIAYRGGRLSEAGTPTVILGQAASPMIAFDDVREAPAVLATLQARPDFIEVALYNANGRRFAALAVDPKAPPILLERLGATGLVSNRGELVLATQKFYRGGQHIGTAALVTRLGFRDRLLPAWASS